jgi:predicted small metal-binding protein
LKTQIAEIFGIDKLEKQNPQKAQDALDSWDRIINDDNAETQKRVFLHALGAHRLNETIQHDLIEKLELIIQLTKDNKPIPKSLYEFYYNTPETPKPAINEVMKKEYWNFDKQKESVKTYGGTDVIKADSFRWSQKDSYGSNQDNLI